jgi:hypothetical protein
MDDTQGSRGDAAHYVKFIEKNGGLVVDDGQPGNHAGHERYQGEQVTEEFLPRGEPLLDVVVHRGGVGVFVAVRFCHRGLQVMRISVIVAVAAVVRTAPATV